VECQPGASATFNGDNYPVLRIFGQLAHDNPDSAEKMDLGGIYTAPAY
jgi:hypothetical protein